MPEIGSCPKCPKGSRTVLLIAGLCNAHFQDSKAVVIRNAAPSAIKALAEKKKTLTVWYNEQIKKIPERCENCNSKIIVPAVLPKRTPVAHILPKASFDSIKTNDDNVWYGCVECHTKYDRWPIEKVATMKIVRICKARYQKFKHLLSPIELRRVPIFLID